MELSEDEVLEILKLFEQSKFDFLQLQQGERKITVSKGGYTPQGDLAPPSTPAQFMPAQSMAAGSAAAPPPTRPAAAAPPAKTEIAPTEGLEPITAPIVGKFD